MPGGPCFWGPRTLFLKKKRKRGARKHGARKHGAPENAGSQKPRGPTKRFYNENGIMKATHALLVITL